MTRWWMFGAVFLLGACENAAVAPGSAPGAAEIPAADAVPCRLIVTGNVDALAREQMTKAVRAALAARGLRPVEPPAVAEVVVTLDLRIGPPHEGRIRSSEPVYEITKGKEEYQSVAVGIGGTGSTIYEMRKVKQPDTQVYQGERPVTVVGTVFEKRLRLSARENAGSAGLRPDRELWSLELVSEGRARDLRRMLPALAGPGRPFLGGDASGEAVLRIDDDTGGIESVDRAL